MAHRIAVNIPDNKPYDIVIERGSLHALPSYLQAIGLVGQVVIATNTTVADLYGAELQTKCNAGMIVMQDGEVYKNLDSMRDLYAQLVATGADRHTILVALGGGVVGDTAGFVAATYMRGIRLVQIPTTLLSMVDSSVGGKVGIDLPEGKNLVGAFKQPELVLIDPDVLATLPSDQWRSGMAEVIKHGLLKDPLLLDLNLHQVARASDLVARAVQVKVDIVQEDPYEHGIRAYLNLGHTFGHAIEQVTHYEWSHGDAVGVGLLLATKLSYRLGLCEESLIPQVDQLLATVGLPRSIGDLEPEAIFAAMATDKKWKSGISRFVLLEGLAKPCIKQGVPKEDVLAVLTDLRLKR